MILKILERVCLILGLLTGAVWFYLWYDSKQYQETEQQAFEQELPQSETRAALKHLKEGERIGRLRAPRLNLSVIVSQGVSDKTLNRSPGRIPGTALPGAPGNLAIAGHRDSHFRALKDVKKGDDFYLEMDDRVVHYQVESTEIIRPNNIQPLKPTADNRLTLVTCYPFYYVGSAPKRFVVTAKEVETSARYQETTVQPLPGS